MITKNADGTYTVADAITCLSEEAALALLEDTGVFPLVDPLTVRANRARYLRDVRTTRDEVSGMPLVEIVIVDAA